MGKRNIAISFGFFIVLFFFGVIVGRVFPQKAAVLGSIKINQIQSIPHVSVEIDDGNTIATESAVASTAYEALVSVTKEKGMVLEVKQYDFGVFVQKVGDKVSSATMSWIYFINGQSGTVAADKTILKENDVVSWKYMKPSM
jgi:hypothetical protein